MRLIRWQHWLGLKLRNGLMAHILPYSRPQLHHCYSTIDPQYPSRKSRRTGDAQKEYWTYRAIMLRHGAGPAVGRIRRPYKARRDRRADPRRTKMQAGEHALAAREHRACLRHHRKAEERGMTDTTERRIGGTPLGSRNARPGNALASSDPNAASYGPRSDAPAASTARAWAA